MAFFQNGVENTLDEKKYDESLQCTGLSDIAPILDRAPVDWVFASSVFGLTWWLVQLFIYAPSVATYKLKDVNNRDTIPFIWSWENISNSTVGYTAISYLLSFFLGIFTHFMPFIGYFQYLDKSNFWVSWWLQYPAWYLTVFGLILPWLFLVLQLTMPVTQGGFAGNYNITTTEFAANAVMNLVMDLAVHLFQSVLLIFLGPRYVCHIAAVEKDIIEKRGPPCPVQRNFMMTDDEYDQACAAVAKVAAEKAKEEAAKRAAYEAELEAELGEEIEFRDDGWI